MHVTEEFNSLINLLIERLFLVAPALKLKTNGKVFVGKKGDTHSDLYDRLIQRYVDVTMASTEAIQKRINEMIEGGKIEEGFVDDKGKFYNKQEALALANNNEVA